MSTQNTIQAAIEAAKAGDKAAARNILTNVIRREPTNARAWFLLSQVVEAKHQQIYCLEQVLAIDPNNQQVKARIQALTEHIDQQPVVVQVQPPAPPAKPSRRWLVPVLAVIAVLVVGGLFASGYWYTQYGPCGKSRVNDSLEELRASAKKFVDANDIASSTGRIALSGPVGRMQDVRAELENIETPACLEKAKKDLVAGMEDSIQAYILFMQEGEDAYIKNRFDSSAENFTSAAVEMKRIGECAPLCSDAEE